MNLSAAVALATAFPLACGDDSRPSSGTDGSTSLTSNSSTTSASTTGTASGTTDAPTGGSGDTGVITAGSTATTTTTGSTGPVDQTTTGEPACEPATCSDDLKSLVCDGEVVDVCDDGAYCIEGACTPLAPCEAAALLKGSEGCDFWAVKTEISLPGSCFAAFIANKTAPPPKPPQTRRCPRSPRNSAVWRRNRLTGSYRDLPELTENLATAWQRRAASYAFYGAPAREPPRRTAGARAGDRNPPAFALLLRARPRPRAEAK